jgi:hypothetical protein
MDDLTLAVLRAEVAEDCRVITARHSRNQRGTHRGDAEDFSLRLCGEFPAP